MQKNFKCDATLRCLSCACLAGASRSARKHLQFPEHCRPGSTPKWQATGAARLDPLHALGPDISKKVKGISMLLFKRLRHEEKHVDTAWRRRGRCFRRWRAVIMSHIWVISDT